MEIEIIVESLPLLGVCNLCLTEGAVKSMLASQKHDGIQELYADMLLQCFSIDISKLELGDTKRLVCNACIGRLRDAVQFKELCQRSLKILMQNVKSQDEIRSATAVAVKNEDSIHESLDDSDDFTDQEDNITLNEIKEKEDPKKVKPIKKSKKTLTKSKTKTPKASSKADLMETEILLDSGLFPFKMRKNGSFSCLLCSVKAPDLEELEKHVHRHSKLNIQTAFQKMLFSSYQRFYQMGTKLRCKICKADVSDLQELKTHMDICSQTKVSNDSVPYKLEKDQLDCPVCKKTFLNHVAVNTHMNVHYPNYICENCSKPFATKARLRAHMRTHETGTFSCPSCEAIFDSITKRENHVSKKHKAGVKYACKRCGITLSSFYARQKHLADVHNEQFKRYQCKLCPQRYATSGHLSSHVRRDHLNERNHKCDKCELAFYSKNALTMHMVRHDGARIFACHVCQKSYQRKKTLTEHLRIHNKDNRFVCTECGKSFTQKCNLRGHLKIHEKKVDVDRTVMPLASV